MAVGAETVLNSSHEQALVVGCERVATYASDTAVEATYRRVYFVLQLKTGAGAPVAGSKSDIVRMAGGHVEDWRRKA